MRNVDPRHLNHIIDFLKLWSPSCLRDQCISVATLPAGLYGVTRGFKYADRSADPPPRSVKLSDHFRLASTRLSSASSSASAPAFVAAAGTRARGAFAAPS